MPFWTNLRKGVVHIETPVCNISRNSTVAERLENGGADSSKLLQLCSTFYAVCLESLY